MFDSITQSLTGALGRIVRGRITEANIREAMQEVRRALLEADVSYDIADAFVKRITEEAVGEKVLKSLRPSEQIYGIVYKELVALMGPVDQSLHLKKGQLSILMMCGLQGSGKTTTCGKLARMLVEAGKKPWLVAADLQRPAAIEQLKVIGQQIGVPVHAEDPAGRNPVDVCVNGVAAARKAGADLVILDTAGRLHIDDSLMNELRQIDRKLSPDQVFLVCDSMTGQDAVNSAKVFNDSLELDGVILTKLDGDTRGGAALSVKAVTGVPIKFLGVGEQLDKLEPFHPERLASRILGGGDLATLAEKVSRSFDEEELRLQQEKMLAGKYTLEDFQKQMSQLRRLGSMRDLLKMIPGMGQLSSMLGEIDAEKDMGRINAMISSMTPYERRNPEAIDRSRRIRIATGSGTEPTEVHNLLKQFSQMSTMMQRMSGLGKGDQMAALQQMTQTGLMGGGAGGLLDKKLRSKRGPADVEKLEEKRKKQRKDARKARKRNRK